ncbi:MAG: hypothetical protein K0S12_2465, partial [Bacteroidetes bacterium]|nr:hypothetical protein [Bacteroidota bacterium]
MKYNMRCKNALISTQTAPNQGCGEWDYSCNTFIVDSTKIENDLNVHPNYIVANTSGTAIPYVTQQLYDYYNFSQTGVTLNNIIAETQYSVATGATPISQLINTTQKSGRLQILYTAAELSAAGLTPGNIHGFFLKATGSGIANFMKVGVQHTSLNSLNSGTATVTGFTNVYNSTYTFATGDNRIQFHTPFFWNGTSKLLIDLSFTNTQPNGGNVILNGTSTSTNMTLYANNNYALDLASLGHVNINASQFNTINNEITVTFWADGRSNMMPSN